MSRCSAVFIPADPSRTGLIAFWNPDGSTPSRRTGILSELTVAEAGLRRRTVPGLHLPLYGRPCRC
ncbi:DEAD/DEAH box helicase OS=Streptomyces cyaneofuscatus OX=66883 GN=G3I52_08240 PE=4 SV=1 [Streptomyces cyaneofuscatus]